LAARAQRRVITARLALSFSTVLVVNPGRISPAGSAATKIADQVGRPRFTTHDQFAVSAHFAKCAEVRFPRGRSHHSKIENCKSKSSTTGRKSPTGPAPTKIVDQVLANKFSRLTISLPSRRTLQSVPKCDFPVADLIIRKSKIVNRKPQVL